MSRVGVAAMSVTLVAAGIGTGAYALVGRRSPAAADAPGPTPAAATVALRATISAERVPYGAAVRVTGEIRDPAGAPLPGLPVEVLAAPLTDRSDVSVVATAVSGAAGAVTASFRPEEGSDVWLRFAGAPGLAEATSSAVPVDVAPRITVSSRTVATATGWTVAITGSVTPARPGSRVRLDRRAGSDWEAVQVARLTGGSTYTFTVRTAAPGVETYRVTRPADGAFAAAAAQRAVRLVPSPPAPRTPAKPRTAVTGRLLVAGDSFAFFLGRQLEKRREPRVTTIDSRHSSGLSRPDFFDWAAHARRQSGARLGGVVAFLGANDCQPVRVGGTGKFVEVGTDAWIGEYRRRAAQTMRGFAAGGKRPVYWVGLPIVRKADIADCYRAINTATAGAARATGVTWVDSWSVYAVDGEYSDVVDGVRARQDDGIHLTYEGTRLLTRKVYALLRG